MQDETTTTTFSEIARHERDQGQRVRTLDRIADAAGVTDGVLARDVHAGDWVIRTDA